MGVIGYNFEFHHPFSILFNFQLCFWEYTKQRYALDTAGAHYKQKMKMVFNRFMEEAFNIALSSATLPLALYFEPEEIAISSLCIASRQFRNMRPFPSAGKQRN